MTPIRILAGALAAAFACPAAARACTLAPYAVVHGDSGAVLLVRPTPDTTAAGPGAVEISPYGGHVGPRRRGGIYGHVVEVERSGGPMAGAVPPGRAVLVPWDYDPACEPSPWGRSARWLARGSRRAVLARLRAPEHWVDGLPTLDVFNTEMLRPDSRTPAGEAEMLFGFHAALPSAGQLERDPWAAVEPVRAWLAANPGAASHPLVRWSARALHQEAASHAVRAAPSPLAGTWRFEVSRTGGPTHVFHARTAQRPSRALASRDTATLIAPSEAAGYSLRAVFSASPQALPGVGASPRGPDDQAENGELEVQLPGHPAPDGSLRFAGFAEPVNFTGLFFKTDPELDAWVGELLERFFETRERETLGEAVIWPDGRVTWTQVMEIGRGRVVTLRGERISDAAWADAPDGG
jgi:hypothetical protein